MEGLLECRSLSFFAKPFEITVNSNEAYAVIGSWINSASGLSHVDYALFLHFCPVSRCQLQRIICELCPVKAPAESFFCPFLHTQTYFSAALKL